MPRIDPNSLTSLIDQALSGNFLNLADALYRFRGMPELDFTAHRYPPTNISALGESSWLIELAVAGFSKDDLKVTLEKDNTLVITGSLSAEPETAPRYIKRGIGLRSFTERYALAEGAKVTDVKLTNGLLQVKVERDPAPEPEPQVLQITMS